MEVSQVYDSCQYAVPSPSGAYIASLTSQHLYVQWAHSLAPAYTFPLEREGGNTSIGENSTIQWSTRSSHLALLSTQSITIFSLYDIALKIHITNGSGSLGKIIAAEIIGDAGGEQVMVVWEFGRVNMWDLKSGKSYEIGDAKMTGVRSGSWAVRRQEGNAEVFALISRTNAQDVLSLYLTPSPIPFKSIQLPSTDAQCISWSKCGRWLAVLDSSLALPSVFVYTTDGNLFRSYPQAPSTPPTTPKMSQDSLSLGSKSMSWSLSAFALNNSTASITVLDTRKFSPVAILAYSEDTSTMEDVPTAWQENISSSGARSYAFLTGSSIPSSTSRSTVMTDMRFNPSETLLATRDETVPSAISVWSLERRKLHVQLLQHSTIKKMVWHPVRDSLLLILGDNGCLYLWDLINGQPPVHVPHAFTGRSSAGKVDARWISKPDSLEQRTAILVTTKKAGWVVVWPEGRAQVDDETQSPETEKKDEGDDVTQDSLYDILAGRTPLPELDGKSLDATGYFEAGGGEDSTRLDDTFRDKKAEVSVEDDSEIF